VLQVLVLTAVCKYDDSRHFLGKTKKNNYSYVILASRLSPQSCIAISVRMSNLQPCTFMSISSSLLRTSLPVFCDFCCPLLTVVRQDTHLTTNQYDHTYCTCNLFLRRHCICTDTIGLCSLGSRCVRLRLNVWQLSFILAIYCSSFRRISPSGVCRWVDAHF
jgi:hypothetical protein